MAAKFSQSSQQPSSSQCVENLESRILCRAPRPAKIAAAYLDNRGQAFLTVTVALDTTTLSRKTAALYTAGVDNVLGTSDDVRLYTKVGYRKGRLSLRSDALGLDDKYRVVLNSSVIKDVNGLALDGEFNGMGEISGDGTAGGNYDVVTTPATKTRVRFTTVAGYINVGMYRNTPITKANFMHYVQEGGYDDTIFHRSIDTGIHIIQGGGFTINHTTNKTGKVHQHTQIVNEQTNPYLKGTIAMANAGKDTNGSEWYFNTGDNTAAWNPGDYTVFGAVLDAESQTTLDALIALPTTGNTVTVPLNTVDKANIDPRPNVPVRDAQRVFDRSPDAAHNNFVFNPNEDLVTIDRVAALFDVAATPGTGAARSLASDSAPAAVAPASLRPASATLFATRQLDDRNSVLNND